MRVSACCYSNLSMLSFISIFVSHCAYPSGDGIAISFRNFSFLTRSLFRRMLFVSAIALYVLAVNQVQAGTSDSYLFICDNGNPNVPALQQLITEALPCPSSTGFTASQASGLTFPLGSSSTAFQSVSQTILTTSASISLNMPIARLSSSTGGAAQPTGNPTNSGLNVSFASSYGPIPGFYNALLSGRPYLTVVLVSFRPTVGPKSMIAPASAYILSNAYVTQVTGGDFSRDYSVSFTVPRQLTVQSWVYRRDGTATSPAGVVATWDFSTNSQIKGK
jgi:hypothetical protein